MPHYSWPNASILFASKSCSPNPLLSVPIIPSCKVEKFLSSRDSATEPGGNFTCPENLLRCHCIFPLCSSHPFICPRSSSICLEINQNHCIVYKGAKTDPFNNRPIGLLPLISKVMESIIAVNVKWFLFSNNLISVHQFGFRPGHSTLYMLLLLSQQWMEALNLRHEIRSIYRDISHAFDIFCIHVSWHPSLLSKLSADGIQVQLHTWFSDFLFSRS